MSERRSSLERAPFYWALRFGAGLIIGTFCGFGFLMWVQRFLHWLTSPLADLF